MTNEPVGTRAPSLLWAGDFRMQAVLIICRTWQNLRSDPEREIPRRYLPRSHRQSRELQAIMSRAGKPDHRHARRESEIRYAPAFPCEPARERIPGAAERGRTSRQRIDLGLRAARGRDQ